MIAGMDKTRGGHDSNLGPSNMTRFGDYTKLLKGNAKGPTQFDDVSEHLMHTDRCGPNCPHLNRDGGRSPRKGKR